MRRNVLEVKDLVRNYRKSVIKESEEDVKVLKGINFQVAEGEFVGIMGKSMVRNLIKAGFELHIYARTKSKVEDVVNIGDELEVKVTEIDRQGRVNLSHKVLL